MYEASVIIPSHDRGAVLPRALGALAAQDFPPSDFEVIVSAAACSDRTVQIVQDYSRNSPYRLRVVALEEDSTAEARNRGARLAEGATLIFLDPDIEAGPSLVRAHLAARAERVVTIGYSNLALPARPDQWQLEARLRWEDRYRRFRTRGCRLGYRDFLFDNCALSADLFRRTGGFDRGFHRLQGCEYGVRLIQSGARPVHVPEAAGLRHDSIDLAQWVERVRLEGAADVHVRARHPVLRTTLFDLGQDRLAKRILRRLAFLMARNGDGMVQAGLQVARVLERLKLRRRRTSLIAAIRLFNYWRGVAEAVNSMSPSNDFAVEETEVGAVAPDAPCLEWTRLPDPTQLDEILGSQKGIRILVDGVEALTITPEPWSEPLRVEHIERLLGEINSRQIVPAFMSFSAGALLKRSAVN